MRYCRAMAAHSHPISQTGYSPQFVASVLDDALAHRSRVYGIVGLQGTGKSTLAAQIAAMAKTRGLTVVALSIDDFYLGRRERLRLGHKIHPLLATRGPPGTHDVALACATLPGLKAGTDPALALFSPLASLLLPPSLFLLLPPSPSFLLFSTFFLPFPPQYSSTFQYPLHRLER